MPEGPTLTSAACLLIFLTRSWILRQVVEGMRPFLLPIFFYAGQVNAAAESTGLSSSQMVALAEMRVLLVWVLLQLGILTHPEVRRTRAPDGWAFLRCDTEEGSSTHRGRDTRIANTSQEVLIAMQCMFASWPSVPEQACCNAERSIHYAECRCPELSPWDWVALCAGQGD